MECTRIRGDAVAFHRDCQVVLVSARSEIEGINEMRQSLSILLTSRIGCNDVGAEVS